MVYALLFLAFCVVEFGLAFQELAVGQPCRSGGRARAGAIYGDDPTADIQIPRDVERTLAPVGIANGMNVRVFKADARVGREPAPSYTPGSDCSDNNIHREEEDQPGAASLVVLMGMAAFGYDLAWFYLNASRIQRAAVAAALGGVIWLPGQTGTGDATALDIALRNG